MSDFNADGAVHDAVIDGLCAGMVPGDHTDVQRTLVSMAKELRQRRAADSAAEDAAFQRGRESVEHWKRFAMPVLSDDEREALAFAMVVMTAGTKWEHAMHDPVVRDHVENCRRSIAALDKLTSKPGGK